MFGVFLRVLYWVASDRRRRHTEKWGQNTAEFVCDACVYTQDSVMAASSQSYDHVASHISERDGDREIEAYALLSLKTAPTSPGSGIFKEIFPLLVISIFYVELKSESSL